MLTGYQTNVTSITATITIPGVCTNRPAFLVNSNSVLAGDNLPLAFARANSNFVWSAASIGSNAAAIVVNATAWTNLNASFSAYLATNSPLVFSNTVGHSTNSTFGYGAGLLACDTNWVYVSIATNTWRRISIPTNTW